MNRKEAYEEHYKMWSWIVDNIQFSRDICELKKTYLRNHNIRRETYGDTFSITECFLCCAHPKSCDGCPLGRCGDPASLYVSLLRAEDLPTRKRYAEQIRDCVRQV